MDPRGSAGQDGSSPATATTTSTTSPIVRRRLSMEDDMRYRNLISTPIRRPTNPSPSPSPSPLPPYDLELQHGNKTKTTIGGAEGRQEMSLLSVEQHHSRATGTISSNDTKFDLGDIAALDGHLECLPQYSNSIALEGVFRKKHEIENTTKRAEDRRWHTSFVVLQGTALHIYSAKKDWGWGRSRDGPTVCPDSPPWIRKAKLERTYSLLHADAGIAADYKKRRYVIRIRAETDQFLLSCIELSTFIKWLEGLFAAIDVAAPIDDRDFPRDMSMPRIQRVRWFRNHTGAVFPVTVQEPIQETSQAAQQDDDDDYDDDDDDDDHPTADAPDTSTGTNTDTDTNTRTTSPWLPTPTPAPHRPRSGQDAQSMGEPPSFHPRHDHNQLMITPSNPNPAIDPHTGKWFPEHRWTAAHDLLYAKLCYSNLLFASPRKSNYIISKGKQWFVNWDTGKMVRVLPPAYGETEGYFGPWQVVHTENRRI